MSKLFFVSAIVITGGLLWTQPVFAVDMDNDMLNDELELTLYHTDPTKADTDGDGYNDYQEIYQGYSPLTAEAVRLDDLDTDNDGLWDSWEIKLGSDLRNPDTDGDGYSDWKEVENGFSPTSTAAVRLEKRIEVSIPHQHLNYYFGDVALANFPISGGVASMPTPLGQFTILDKVPVKRYGGPGFGFDYPNTKWNLHFTTRYWRYYIHGAYWHNNFGKPMSHGCVNVDYANMEKLYNFADLRTKVIIL